MRTADPRLLLPLEVRSARLLGDVPGWLDALTAAGVPPADDPDLVVASRNRAGEAVAAGAPAVIVLGEASRALRRAGYHTDTVLVRRGRHGPRLYVPVRHRRAAIHTLAAPAPGRTGPKRLAVRALLAGMRRGAPFPGVITLGVRTPGPPRILAAAEPLGVPPDAEWYLLVGDGDDLQRLVWFCFGADDQDPRWVVKTTRVRGNSSPFASDERALRTLDPLPPALRRHAPLLLGRFDIDGLPGSVETAAAGPALDQVLAGGLDDRTSGLIDAVADWICAVGVVTARPPADLAPELERLETEVLPAWEHAGARPGLASGLSPIPAVVQHNDLGCWNIHVSDDGFVVVDWESGRGAGLPLWDLVYFLADGLAAVTRPPDQATKRETILAILRGDHPLSARLHRRVAAAADELGVPRDAVGPIVTLGWLHHGLSAGRRSASGRDHGATTGGEDAAGPLQRLGEPWLRDPALGVRWSAFLDATGGSG